MIPFARHVAAGPVRGATATMTLEPSTSSRSSRARSGGDTRPVRAGEELDWTALEAWLRARLAASSIPAHDLRERMQVAQFPGGHSNLTYHVRFGGSELVVRRPPFGPVPPTAHDMAREYRWLSAVHPAFPLAPRVYALCEDPAIVGSVFYVMERRHGIVVRDDEPPSLRNQPDVRRALSFALVDALAALHAIDVAAAGLAHLGKPLGFVERQVRGWTERWTRSRTSDVPEMEAVARWLIVSLPPNPDRPAIVHGDFKLDNLMIDATDPRRLVAVFDWEMAALGDPLVDLGILLAYWVATAPSDQHDALTTVTTLPGWLTPGELVERYAARSGCDLTRLTFYEVFALFKIAVVVQQIFFRFVNGQTSDQRFANLGARVTYLARRAAALL
jgi:aminoglycoside phosphotransferase (APT) family kinase protein